MKNKTIIAAVIALPLALAACAAPAAPAPEGAEVQVEQENSQPIPLPEEAEEAVVEEEPATDAIAQRFIDNGFDPMYEDPDQNDVWIKWGTWDRNGFTTSVVVRLGFSSDRCESWKLEGNFYDASNAIVGTGYAFGSNAMPGDEFKEELVDFSGEASRVQLTEFNCYGF